MKKPFYYGLLILVFSSVQGQVGVQTLSEGVQNGYTLIHPQDSDHSYLISNNGYLVHKWEGNAISGKSLYLLENSLLLRTMNSKEAYLNGGGVGGIIELIAWDGTPVWRYKASSENEFRQHHDVQYLPNGNILSLEWVSISAEEAIANGRNPATLVDFATEIWSERIVEYKPIFPDGAEVVWQWNLWDHIIQDFDASKSNYGVVAENPGKLDVNFLGLGNSSLPADWLHMNSISYNEVLDQIVLSSPFLSEIYVIDHSTTTSEAATNLGGNYANGGDFLFRWGNPQSYKRGMAEDQRLFGQHTARWLKETGSTKIILFNNGNQRPEGEFSTIEIITLPDEEGNGFYDTPETTAYEPSEALIQYIAETPTDFYSRQLSGAQILPNGNMLICEGLKGKLFEINKQNEIVWQFVNPARINNELCINDVSTANPIGLFRGEKYPLDYPGLPDGLLPAEVLYWESDCIPTSVNNETYLSAWPNPFSSSINVVGGKAFHEIRLMDQGGRVIFNNRLPLPSNSEILSLEDIPSGSYLLQIGHQNGKWTTINIIKK
jgi:hypothetical protein